MSMFLIGITIGLSAFVSPLLPPVFAGTAWTFRGLIK